MLSLVFPRLWPHTVALEMDVWLLPRMLTRLSRRRNSSSFAWLGWNRLKRLKLHNVIFRFSSFWRPSIFCLFQNRLTKHLTNFFLSRMVLVQACIRRNFTQSRKRGVRYLRYIYIFLGLCVLGLSRIWGSSFSLIGIFRLFWAWWFSCDFWCRSLRFRWRCSIFCSRFRAICCFSNFCSILSFNFCTLKSLL